MGWAAGLRLGCQGAAVATGRRRLRRPTAGAPSQPRAPRSHHKHAPPQQAAAAGPFDRRPPSLPRVATHLHPEVGEGGGQVCLVVAHALDAYGGVRRVPHLRCGRPRWGVGDGG